MITRQVIPFMLMLFMGISSCAPAPMPVIPPPTATPLPPTSTVIPTVFLTPTATPVNCLNAPGQVKQDVVTTTKPQQEFIIYLPPCYDASTDHYPTLYLLNGQTYNQDQWIRLGAARVADELIHSQQSMPFIIVLPDDRYWNSPAGAEFGNRLIYSLVPYVDENYRTRADRRFRALGGLSRGGGWTAQLGFEHPDLFGILGLHSPAFKESPVFLADLINKIPVEGRPKLWHDIGEEDTQLGDSLVFEQILADEDYVHVFHRFAGNHSEEYWSAHLEQYLRWYVAAWQENLAGQ